jgi:hypothetical protein
VIVVFHCMAICGCTTPIEVAQVDPRTLHQVLTRNILSRGKLNEPIRIVLTCWDLRRQIVSDPDATLTTLQGLINAGTAGSDEVYARAEPSFQHAKQTGKSPFHLAAAVYAFAFLFPESADTPPSPYDPRWRTASDLYGRGLTLAFESSDGSRADPRGGECNLPFSKLRVTYEGEV